MTCCVKVCNRLTTNQNATFEFCKFRDPGKTRVYATFMLRGYDPSRESINWDFNVSHIGQESLYVISSPLIAGITLAILPIFRYSLLDSIDKPYPKCFQDLGCHVRDAGDLAISTNICLILIRNVTNSEAASIPTNTFYLPRNYLQQYVRHYVATPILIVLLSAPWHRITGERFWRLLRHAIECHVIKFQSVLKDQDS